MVFIKNKYARIYSQIVERAKLRELSKPYERHHVLPKAFGGVGDKSNLVTLTFREHFLVHWLLTKFTQGEDQRKMLYALIRMGRVSKHHTRIVSSWQYDLCKRAAIAAVMGTVRDAAYKEKMRISVVNSVKQRAHILALNKSRKGTFIHREQWERMVKEHRKGARHSEQGKKNISVALQLLKRDCHCEHCDKFYKKNTYSGYHGPRCKMVGKPKKTRKLPSLTARNKTRWADPEYRAAQSAVLAQNNIKLKMKRLDARWGLMG